MQSIIAPNKINEYPSLTQFNRESQGLAYHDCDDCAKPRYHDDLATSSFPVRSHESGPMRVCGNDNVCVSHPSWGAGMILNHKIRRV